MGHVLPKPLQAEVWWWLESYSGTEPSVVAQNARGEKRVIAVFKNLQEAESGAAVIERDLKTLGTAAWCEQYDVPLDFVS